MYFHESKKLIYNRPILISKTQIGRKQQSFVHLKSIEK